MEEFNVRIAGLTIGISAHYPALRRFFGEYLCDSEPDFSVSWTEDEIAAEHDGMRAAGNSGSFSMEYLETLAALRKISDVLPHYNRFLMHGAAISFEDKAYIFAAPSGTGKTTHISLWKKYLGDPVDIVNGDKPILSVENGEVIIHGTPWAGKEHWQKNRSVKLGGLCFLERGANRIERISPEESLDRLFQQAYISRDETSAAKTLELLDELIESVPLYLLHCDISEEAVKTSFEAMTGMNFEDKVVKMPTMKDPEKQRAQKRECRKRYYAKTANLYPRHPWTAEEVALVMEHSIPDSALSEKIHRSVKSIQQKRLMEKKRAAE